MKDSELKVMDEEADKELEKIAQGERPAADAPPGPDTVTPPADTPPDGETPGTGLATPPGDVPPSATPKSEETVEHWKEEARIAKEEARIANERYAAINGKYMAEIPRLKADIDRLMQYQPMIAEKDREIQDLKDKLAEALKSNGAGVPATSAEDTAIKAAIEKLRFEHGDTFADTMGELIAPFQATIQSLKTALADAEAKKGAAAPPAAAPAGSPAPRPSTSTVSPEEQFFTDLTMAVADWPEINRDPKWFAFMGQVNPATGNTWQADLDLNHGQWNVEGVADIFKAFKKSVAPVAAVPGKPKFEGLEEHVDPSTISGGNKPLETKKTYTQTEVDAFDLDIQKGRAQKTMTAAEIQARLDEYELASKEGRVR